MKSELVKSEINHYIEGVNLLVTTWSFTSDSCPTPTSSHTFNLQNLNQDEKHKEELLLTLYLQFFLANVTRNTDQCMRTTIGSPPVIPAMSKVL